jgi:hypothetical protein
MKAPFVLGVRDRVGIAHRRDDGAARQLALEPAVDARVEAGRRQDDLDALPSDQRQAVSTKPASPADGTV